MYSKMKRSINQYVKCMKLACQLPCKKFFESSVHYTENYVEEYSKLLIDWSQNISNKKRNQQENAT